MLRRLIVLLFVITIPNLLLAQGNAAPAEQPPDGQAVVTGKLFNPKGNPVPLASVALYDTTGSSLLEGTATDSSGIFRLVVDPGKYRLKISYLSYQPVTRKLQLEAGEQRQMGTIQMKPLNRRMDEVVVRGEESKMELSFDKRVFNVGSDLTGSGNTALDIMEQVPSLSTDIEGNISLRGSQNVRILINGKPSNRVSNSRNDLRSIPAHMIKKVEVITNPSARYAAEGEAGIINIILKKNRQFGMNGSVSANTGMPADHQLAANLNFRRDDINWFLNGSIGYNSFPGSGSTVQRFSSPDTTYRYRENEDEDQSEFEGDLRFGMDYYMPHDQTLTSTISINAENEDNFTDVSYTDMAYQSGDVYQRISRNQNQGETNKDLEFEASYENKLPGLKDHKLTADLNADLSRQDQSSHITENVRSGSADPMNQRSDNLEEVARLLAKTDYVYPYNKHWRFETGLRVNARYMSNDYSVQQRENGQWTTLPNYNQNFSYRENVNAAYGIVAFQFKPWSMQLGLRAEQSNVHTELSKVDSVGTTQNYIDLFPTANLTYSLSESQEIQLSYSRRLSRPDHWDLIPFSDLEDSRNQFIGNPNLDPEFTNSYEAGFHQYWKSGSILSSVYYRYRMGVIERIQTAQNGITRIFPINLATEKNWGVELSLNQEIGETFSFNGNANLFRANTEGSYQDEDLSSHTSAFRGRGELNWEFLEHWETEASFYYRGPRNTTQGRTEGFASMNWSLARELFDGDASISLDVRDVFNSEERTFIVDNKYLYSKNTFRWSTRSVELNITYNFGQDTQQNRRNRGRRGGR